MSPIAPDGTIIPEQAEYEFNPFEQAFLRRLDSIRQLLDLLVKLECNVIKRRDLKLEYESAQAAMAEMRKQAIEAEAAARLDEEAEEEGDPVVDPSRHPDDPALDG